MAKRDQQAIEEYARDQAIAEGLEIGIERGIEQGIRAFVLDGIEDKMRNTAVQSPDDFIASNYKRT